MSAQFSKENKHGRKCLTALDVKSRQNIIGFLKVLIDIEIELIKKTPKIDTLQETNILENKDIYGK